MPANVSPRPDPTTLDPQDLLRERYLSRRPHSSTQLRAYYALKPLVPRRVQLALRRAYARRQAAATFPAWPIEPILVQHRELELRRRIAAAGGGPVPVVGEWPDGHTFAAILTHDVEGPAGIEKVRAVIEIERRYGLVSSFNFVAEWYPIPGDLFERVRAAGCEVGLHGIRHDGKLFADERSFKANLPAIHRYLEEWGAVGFRSPATHRNADWMPRLGCLYDSSFPDTDPFEPLPGGCCSILPYMIDGLVELPITLAQDHTLWEILREESIERWRQKADWIIANRGLVNVIVHPDYLTGARLELYEQLCAYLRDRLDTERGWHALPREVTLWWKARAGLRVERDGAIQVATAQQSDPLARRARVLFAREVDGRVVLSAGEGQPRTSVA
jgi:hypothetical protein